MRWLKSMWFRVNAVVRRSRMERELAEEMEHHVDLETRKNLERGLDGQEARRQALIRFGGVDRMRESARKAWGVSVAQDLQDDTRFALRQLAKRPAFATLAVLTLGLGIGGTVALFSVVNGLLLRPLPYAEDARLVSFWQEYNWRGAEFDFVKEVAQAYDGLAAYSSLGGSFRVDGRTSMLRTGAVSADVFDVLGTPPLLGRTFQEGDDRPGAEPSLVLSHGFWQQEMGGDLGVLGRRVIYDGTPFTIIGVMPEGFYFPAPEYQAWQPLNLDPDSPDYAGNGWLVLIGRLKPEMTEALVQADLDRITVALGERWDYPDAWDKTRGAFVQPLRESLVGDVRPALLLLLGAVGLLLLMACANVTALLLTRTADRKGEIAVRAVLGAGRGRLARQILTEAVVLALLAGAVGIGLALGFYDVVVSMLPLERGFGQTLTLDWTAMAGALLLATAVGSLVSVAPIRSLLGGRIEGALSGGRSEVCASRGHVRMQGALILSEVLLCVMLVSGAALLVRSVAHLRTLDPGFDPAGVLAMDVLHSGAETEPAERSQFFDALIERVEAVPGVRAAGLTNRLPVRDGGWQGTVSVEDRPDLEGAQRPNSYYRTASLGYFESMGMEVVQGRGFEPVDRAGSLEVAIVNETFARRMWGDGDPIGRRVSTGFDQGRDIWLTVVGVVEDARVDGMVGEMPMVTYRPQHQRSGPGTGNVLTVRTDGDPLSLTPIIRGIVSEMDGRVAIAEVTTMEAVVDDALAEPLRLRFFLGLFGALGLVLGTVGVYGVVSYTVSRRWSELGIRMALGAEPGRLVGSVLRAGMLPVVLGVGVGVAASLALSRVLSGFLFGVAPTDPLSFAVAAGVLLVSAVVAAGVPALRASRIHPVEALRSE